MRCLRHRSTPVLFALRLLCAASLLTGGAWLPTQKAFAAPPLSAPQSASSVIQEIVVIGNKNLSTAFILRESGHIIGDVCGEDTLKDMRSRLYASGYFGSHSATEADAVRITSKPTANGKCRVTIAVDENMTLNGLNIVGTGPAAPEQVLSLIHFKAGSVYNGKQLLADALAVQDFYRRKGYSAVISDVASDKKGIMNITVVVNRVSAIKVTGNQKTSAKAILAAMTTKTGDYFNSSVVHEDVLTLMRRAKLKLKEVNLDSNMTGAGHVELVLRVVEK